MTAISGYGGNPASLALLGRGTRGTLNQAADTQLHKYWRFRIDDNNGSSDYTYTEMLYLYDAATGEIATDAGDTDTYSESTRNSSGLGGSDVFQEVGEESPNTVSSIYWQTLLNEDFSHWVQVEFAEPKSISRYALGHIGRSGSTMADAPTKFSLLYSDDGINWTTAHVGEVGWPASEGSEYSGEYLKEFTLYDRIAGSVDLPLFTSTAEGYLTSDITGSASLPLFSGTGHIANEYNTMPLFEGTGEIAPGQVLFTLLPQELSAFSSTAEGASENFYQGAPELPRFTSEATGFQAGDSVGSVMPLFTSTAEAVGGGNAIGYNTMLPLTSEAEGFQAGDGVGSIMLPFESEASGSAGSVSTGFASISLFESVASGFQAGDETGIPPFTSTASGVSGTAGVGVASLALFSSIADGFQVGDETGIPPFTSTAEGTVGSVSIGIASMPLFTSFAAAGGGNVLRLFESLGEAVSGSSGSGLATLPRFTSTASGDVPGAVLPLFESEAAGVSGANAFGSAYLELFTSVAEGDTSAIPDGITGSAVIPLFTSTAFALAENRYNGTASLLRFATAAEGVTGRVGTASVTLPIFTSTAEGYGEYLGTAAVSLPMLQTFATGTSSTVSDPVVVDGVVAGDGIAMNLHHKGLTTYTEFGFNSFAQFQGLNLAANSQGVFALTGDTDNTEIIEASMRLGKLDFDSQQLKIFDHAYLGYQSDGQLCLSVRADDSQKYDYPLEPRKSDDQHTARTKFGKGLKGRYVEFSLSNVDGANFEIDTLDIRERELRRQIR